MKVKLSYFKLRGKWYADGEYETECEHMHQIADEVRCMNRLGGLPGLVSTSKHWIVLIDVPDHQHNHPMMIVPTKQILLQEVEDMLDERFKARE